MIGRLVMGNNELSLFEAEETILNCTEALITNEEYKDNPLMPFLLDITENYKNVLKEFKEIIKISDEQQDYLRKAQMELKDEIERRRSAEEQLHRLASLDFLTGVYNRGMGLSLLGNVLSNIKRTKGLFSICFLDIDELKMVNDNFGHQEGDKLIITVCGSLKDVLRGGDIICRYGGDEFLLVFMEANIAGVEKAMERVIEAPRYRNMKKEKPYKISFSYGIVEVTEENKYSMDELIALADRRMYQHKRIK